MIPVEKTMGVPTYGGQALRWFAATTTAALATILLVGLRANSTTAGMVFLVLVVWWAAQAGIALSIYTAVLSAVCFDYFFLLPLHTFRIEGAQQWVAMVSFALSCLVVARLAERARKQTIRAQQREEDVGKLYSLSQEMMLFEDADRLLRDLPGAIGRIFVLDGVVLYVGDYDRFFSSTGEVSSSLRAHMQAVAQGLNPPGAPFAGYQTGALALGLKPVGALAWRPDTLSLEVATAVSAQVSIAVARSIAIAASTRIEAAREADRLRTALIDSLTHELRTPLTSVRAAATTLLETERLDEAGRVEMVRVINEEAQRLDQLIGEAVEMAEIDANVVQVKMSSVHPRALLDQAVEESRKILAAYKVTILPMRPMIPPKLTSLPGLIPICWAESCAICSKTWPATLLPVRASHSAATEPTTAWSLPSKTTAPASMLRICHTSLRSSTEANVERAGARGRAWDSRLRAPSLSRTAEESKPPALPAAGRGSVFGFR